MSEDLAAWLLGQLAEDERLASAATPPPWQAVLRPGHKGEGHYHGKVAVDVPGKRKWLYWGGSEEGPTAEHVAAWDPARVLAECDAKRRIIDLHRPEHAREWVCCNVCHSGWASELDPADWPCDTVRLLALPYADRPGYRQGWKP